MRDKLVHIVDDEEEVCQSTAFVMRIAGFPCRSWPSGDAFLAGADLQAPGCVILDLRMPGIDGLAVQKTLTQRESTLKVIMVSGHGDLSVARVAIDAGASDFIEKPYDEKLLIATVEKALA